MMNKWFTLAEYAHAACGDEADIIRRGCVLRVPSVSPPDPTWYPDPVMGFIVVQAMPFGAEPYGVSGLLVASGDKAGLMHVIFPKESLPEGYVYGLSTAWLIANWKKWIYPRGNAESVLIRDPETILRMPAVKSQRWKNSSRQNMPHTMGNWRTLTTYGSDVIRRGCILRVPSVPPPEQEWDDAVGCLTWYPDPVVDFIVVDAESFEGRSGLLVASGHKSGLVPVVFPKESVLQSAGGLSTAWLIANWKKWVYPWGSAESVLVREPETILRMPAVKSPRRKS
ncbi:hypothetical protein D5045_02065 [Verminephrobacter eiseniae]|nr:hypothetical protein [Verminephrobacter eiseniae]